MVLIRYTLFMSFGIEGVPQEHWSEEHLEMAIQKLQERRPIFGEDTKEENGKYWIMGLEVQQPQYESFMEKVSFLLDQERADKEGGLQKAA